MITAHIFVELIVLASIIPYSILTIHVKSYETITIFGMGYYMGCFYGYISYFEISKVECTEYHGRQSSFINLNFEASVLRHRTYKFTTKEYVKLQ